MTVVRVRMAAGWSVYTDDQQLARPWPGGRRGPGDGGVVDHPRPGCAGT